jgi:hypothetical protein
MRGILCAGMGLLFWPAAAFGQLAFGNTLVDKKVDPSEEKLEVRFPFKNSQDKAVSVTKIETSCGCLQATVDKKVLEPGESGIVTGIFSVGARTGKYEKALHVKTLLDGKESSQELRVRVEVPVVMEVVPQLVSWEVGEALEPKTIVVTVRREEAIRVKEVHCSRKGFTCEIRELQEGKVYRLDVTPESTETALMGIIRIETDCEISKHRRQLAFFSVKRAEGK